MAKMQMILCKTLHLIFGIKLLFYVDVQLSFLDNIKKTLTEFFINLKTFLNNV